MCFLFMSVSDITQQSADCDSSQISVTNCKSIRFSSCLNAKNSS
ncbi:Protein CBG27103 [Caenorhabditis briggsae]|uniref:Protein CBG27103 n=1 Tax=Caenorhabditis briggsae TaxID=6238 RepID=B6IHH8_CAEBR|nr:Protein CBG27103 [Caenorhabditis briggsae]CAR99358.1 Protein CBG27103 [Caenorhabditis briggsae]